MSKEEAALKLGDILLNNTVEELRKVRAERDEYKRDADALLELLKQSRMETEALKARIDGGIRCLTSSDRVGTLVDFETAESNATLVPDSGAVL